MPALGLFILLYYQGTIRQTRKRQAKTEKSASSQQAGDLKPYRSSRLSTSSSNMPPQKAPLKYAAAIRPMHAGVPAALPNRATNIHAAAVNACLGLIRSTARPRKTLQPRRGCIRGTISLKLTSALYLSRLPATHPRRRCSTKTSRRRAHGSATAPPSSVPKSSK